MKGFGIILLKRIVNGRSRKRFALGVGGGSTIEDHAPNHSSTVRLYSQCSEYSPTLSLGLPMQRERLIDIESPFGILLHKAIPCVELIS